MADKLETARQSGDHIALMARRLEREAALWPISSHSKPDSLRSVVCNLLQALDPLSYASLVEDGRNVAMWAVHPDAPAPMCGRLMVGSGTGTYDPTCELRLGHDGSCRSSAARSNRLPPEWPDA